MDKFGKVPWLDYACPGAFGVALIASLAWGRRVYWVVDTAASFLVGLVLLVIPHVLLSFQITGGQLDVLHLMLCRGVGAFLIGSALRWYFLRNSVDSRMCGNYFFSRIVGCSFMLIAQFYSAYHLWNRSGKRFNEKFLFFSCAGVSAWLLGSLIQLLRLKEIGGYTFKASWLHSGLILDHFALLIFGVINFAFPTQILKVLIKTTGTNSYTIDGIHVCLHRIIASLLLAASISSSAAPGFLYSNDKKGHVLGRLSTQVLIFGLNAFGHFVMDIYTMYHITPFMISGFYITFLLSLYFRFGKEKEK